MNYFFAHLLEEFHLPLKNPVLVFSLLLFIILLSPIVLRKVRIPAIIGLIISGVIIGPHGLGLIGEKTMGRPSKPNTRYFQWTLSEPQRMILLSAGKGNICRGFETVLDLYHYAHNQGYRPDMDMSILIMDRGISNSPNVDCL